MGIPPIIDPILGATCPTGYAYDPTSGACLPVTPPIKVSVTGSDPTQNWSITDINEAQVDQVASGLRGMLGAMQSGWIERFVTAAMHAILLLVLPILKLWISIQDSVYAGIAECLTAGQGEGATGFYQLSAALVSDLFGVEIDGNALAHQYVSGGRLSSITALGGNIINILASEFMGTYQASGATGYTVAPGSGIGGLPDAQMSPRQGVDAARAFLGFATEFGVREGNAEMIAGSIPHELGEGVREMAVTVARGVNLGRMGRVALMPLFKGLVATPLQWAINLQYRPTLLTVTEAIAAFYTDNFDQDALNQELQYQGYADNKIGALTYQHTKHLVPKQVHDLIAKGDLTDTDWSVRLRKERWDVQEQELLLTEMEFAPAREICLTLAKEYVTDYVKGTRAPSDVQDLLSSLPYLTPGEVNWFNGVISATAALAAKGPKPHYKQLTMAEYKKAFYAGLITLGDLETAIAAHYPNPIDQQIVLLEDLIGQVSYQVQQEKLAASAAKLGIVVPGLPKL